MDNPNDVCKNCGGSIRYPRQTGRCQRPLDIPPISRICRQCQYEAWFSPEGYEDSELFQTYVKRAKK